MFLDNSRGQSVKQTHQPFLSAGLSINNWSKNENVSHYKYNVTTELEKIPVIDIDYICENGAQNFVNHLASNICNAMHAAVTQSA